MLKFGNIFDNILTLAVLLGFGYILYMKLRGSQSSRFRNLFSKAGEIVKKTNVKGWKGFGK